MYTHIEKVIETVKAKHAGEPEFVQTVEEVLSSLGPVIDAHPEYEKADLLCLVSRTEGWGLCISEGLAHGVIPVVFNCSAGVNELVEGTGFPVPPADEDLFAETLVRAARLPEKEKLELRKKGMAKAAALDPGIICQKWVNLFREVLSK